MRSTVDRNENIYFYRRRYGTDYIFITLMNDSSTAARKKLFFCRTGSSIEWIFTESNKLYVASTFFDAGWLTSPARNGTMQGAGMTQYITNIQHKWLCSHGFKNYENDNKFCN